MSSSSRSRQSSPRDVQSPRSPKSPRSASSPRSPSSHNKKDKEQERKDKEKEKERNDRVDDLIFTMNDVANDSQDLAMQMRELICELPAMSSLAQDLASNLSLFGRTLRELAQYLGTPAAPFAMTTVDVVNVTLDNADQIFDQVDDMMYRLEKDPNRDFIYYFKDQKVLGLSARLESLRLTLAVILQIVQLRALMNLQEMEDSNDKSLRHRIQDFRLEAQSLILDETWARRKEKLMEDNNLGNLAQDNSPIMPKNTMTEAAAAVTLLLEQLTEPYRPSEKSEGTRGHLGIGAPEGTPEDGSKEKRQQIMETLAKAALAAGVLGAWKSRSKVPLPKGVKNRKDHLLERAKPKHGNSLLSGIGSKIEAIAPVAIAAGAYEVFKARDKHEGAKDKGMRFVNAAKGAAFGAAK